MLEIPDRLDPTAVDDLIGQLHEARRADAVVLTGAGVSFCTGFDLPPGTARETGAWLRDRWGRLVEGLRDLQAPIVAAVDGPALDAGLAIALLADVRIAGPEATFAAAGEDGRMSASGLGWLLSQHLPAGLATSLVLTGRRVDVDTAATWGLIQQHVDGDVVARARGCAGALARADVVARGMARVLRRGEPMPLEDAVLFDTYAVEQRQDPS